MASLFGGGGADSGPDDFEGVGWEDPPETREGVHPESHVGFSQHMGGGFGAAGAQHGFPGPTEAPAGGLVGSPAGGPRPRGVRKSSAALFGDEAQSDSHVNLVLGDGFQIDLGGGGGGEEGSFVGVSGGGSHGGAGERKDEPGGEQMREPKLASIHFGGPPMAGGCVFGEQNDEDSSFFDTFDGGMLSM